MKNVSFKNISFKNTFFSSKSAYNSKDTLLLKLSPSQLLALGFASIILLGALLLTLPSAVRPGEQVNFLTSLFTATSAVCVTGLVVVDTGTHWSTFGHVVIISLIQIGGLGFMTMATFFALLLKLKIGLRQRIFIQESLNQPSIEGIVRLAKYVLIFTFTCEALFAALLAVRFSYDLGWSRGIWYGIFHSVSAFNNAGFDLFGGFKSITGYVEDPIVSLSISTLIILGGIGFSVVVDLYRYKGTKRLTLHTKMALIITGLLIFFGTIIIFLLEYNNTLRVLSPEGKFLASYFQAVTPRTAGYNTLDISKLRTATQYLIIILMFIGASPGSTGGGIKTTTLGTLVLTVWSQVKGKEDTEFFNRRIEKSLILKSMIILIMALTLVLVISFLLTITEQGQDFLMLLFETVSAFGTVGLTMGLTPHLSTAGRLLIILTMFLGRVGPLTVAFALTQKRQKSGIRLPEEKIIVG